MESRVSSLTSRNLELESTNTALSRRVEDILKEMEDAAKNFRSDMARKVSPIETFLSLYTLYYVSDLIARRWHTHFFFVKTEDGNIMT